MRARERIVRERFAEQKCAHCGSLYPSEGVVILARRSSTWMVMASCASCLRPGVFVVSFPSQPAGHSSLPAHESSTIPSDSPIDVSPISSSPVVPSPDQATEAAYSSPHEPLVPVNAADVNAMHEFLATFNGNFARLFHKPE